MEAGFSLFDTNIGRCGIGWSEVGLRGLQLPESDDLAALRRLRRRFPDLEQAEPPGGVLAAIGAVAAFLAGSTETDFEWIPIDMNSIGHWELSVYRAAREIPVGSTVTYGILAERLGDPAKARAVGQALGRNPWPIIVPCHRITAAGGGMGGFSAPGGSRTKLKLLEIEGALAAEALPLFAARGR